MQNQAGPSRQQVGEALALHRKWLADQSAGRCADLFQAKLTGLDLSSWDLRKARLVGADCQRIVLTKANLAEVDFLGADLSNADLSYADLTKANMRGVRLTGANLNHANLDDVDFRGGTVLTGAGETVGREATDLSECSFDFASLARAQMSGSNLSGCSLVGAKLKGAKLAGANLENSNFADADLNGANLAGARLTNTKMKNCNLSNANLKGALAENTDMEGADLGDAVLDGVDLSKVVGGKGELKIDVRNLPDHLRRVFDEHEAWINSNAKQGERGVLIEEDLVGIRLSVNGGENMYRRGGVKMYHWLGGSLSP